MAKDEKKKEKESEPPPIISGALNLFGLKIDLGELLGSPQELTGRLEELREKLKAAGGNETLSAEEWRQGSTTITGHIRTRGPLLGEREFHVGTMGKPGNKKRGRPAPERPEVMEPPVDVFDEGGEVVVIADVPGVNLDDLDLKAEGSRFSLTTRPTAQRSYRKELRLEAEVEPASFQSNCKNGVLEVRLRKREAGGG